MAVTRLRRTKQSTPSAKDKDRLKDSFDFSEASIDPVEEFSALEMALSVSIAKQKTQVEANTSKSSSRDKEEKAPEPSLKAVQDDASFTVPFADALGLSSTMTVEHTEQEGAGAVINQTDSCTATAAVYFDVAVHPDSTQPQAQDVMAQIDAARGAISLSVSGAKRFAVPSPRGLVSLSQAITLPIHDATTLAQGTTIPLQGDAVEVRQNPFKSIEPLQESSHALLSEFEVFWEK